MNKKQNRMTSAIVSFLMLLYIIPLSGTAASSELRYDSSGYMEFMDDTVGGKALYEQYKTSLPSLPGGGVPPQFKTISGTKLYINYRLWRDQGILCYGNYTKVPRNDFKSSTQKPGHPVVKNKGYYLYNGKCGEFRYHGYDVSGNKLTNLNFEPDSVVTKFNERSWIINPWTELPQNKRPQQRSVYNDAATGDKIYADPTVKPGVQKWINKSLQQYGGVPLNGSVTDPEVYRYLYVESAPSLQGIGQGRMWHIRPNSSIWYQTIAVPQLTAKENLPVNAVIELLTDLPENITDVGTAMDDKEITLKFKVSAQLQDTDVYNDPVKMTVYYTRYDIYNWNISFSGPDRPAQTDTEAINTANKGSSEFEYTTTYGFLKTHSSTVNGKTTWNLHFTAAAKPNYKDSKQGLTGNASYTLGINVEKPPELPVVIIEDFNIEQNIPEIAYDGVPFVAADNTDMSRVECRKVFIDGLEVDGGQFFSGSYIFPGSAGVNGRFAYVDCEYKVKDIAEEFNTVTSRDVVYIYPTKPIANFKISSKTWKQNRLINVQDASTQGNIQLVIQKYPIAEYEWSYGGNTAQLRRGTDTDISKELLYKKPGIYSLTLRVKNTLGKWSDPYTVDFQVLDDVAPAVGVNLSGSVYTRNDKVSAWYYDAASTDGDVIKSSSIELWYDSNNDGALDQKLNTWNNREQFPDYTPAKLGYYKYILTAKEDIIGDTLPQHITEADKKSACYEVEFWVDNYQPLSDIYVNIPIQRPNIDVYFMLDKDLDSAKKDYILNNRVNMSNWLLGKNIIPNVSIWDMRTYTYEQSANTSKNTGSSYPPSSTSYSSNGYSGTLSRTSVTNNSYSRDEGRPEDRTESKTATGSATGDSTAIYTAGKWGGWVITSSSKSDTPSISYSDDQGFTGTLYKTSTVCTSDNGPPVGLGTPGQTYTRSMTFSASYSGTVTRRVRVWVPNIVWYDNYTGYYSGTIYKDVRQPYTDNFNPTALKYVVYISDSTISELSDLNMVMNYAKTARLMLAGTNTIKSQRAHDHYFDISGKSVDTVINEILQSIADSRPSTEKYYVLQNQSFTMNVGQFDLESDPIIETGMQYVHEPGYYDNPTGTEPGSVSSYSDSAGWTATVKSSLANTGKYTIYRRVKDRPTAEPNFSAYSYYSGSTSLEVYVVRKPIALAQLDWDFDSASNTYRTTWVDNSYDPDHQYSRPDKGIVDRNIMWRKTGGQWHYGIPDNLSPGNYELHYYVLDPEGYWSDPFIMNFTLDSAPQMQFRASLRTLDKSFSLASVPASEKLEAYDLWTRFPNNVKLEMALYNGSSRVTPVKRIEYSSSTGVKSGNDISWYNAAYQIPGTLPDCAYEFRISAVGDYGYTAEKGFTVKVSTPLNLEPSLPSEAVGSMAIQAGARTSKYADSVRAVLFHGTPYERTYNLTEDADGGITPDIEGGSGGNGGLSRADGGTTAAGKKYWGGSLTLPGSIPDGNYTARFIAIAPNGTSQSKDVPFKLVNVGISNVNLSGYWNHWRGQQDIFGRRMTNEPHRFLSLECVKIDISTIGNPERVTVRFSPELEAMSYTDPNGHVYSYKNDYFGYTVNFPDDSTFPADGNRIYWEYHLPLAPSTKDWDGNRLRSPYKMIVTVYKGDAVAQFEIDDIEITGNIYDLTYIQPKSD